jgi:hypothetical protein
MKVDELKNEEMYVLVAPDGSIQLTTLAPDYAMCIGMAQLLAKSGIGQPVGEMFEQGFEVMPVKVTILQNGDAESAFQKAKRKINKQ